MRDDGSSPLWQIDHHAARLCVDHFSGSLDLHQPGRGLHDLRLGEHALPGIEVLGVNFAAPAPSDAYVRIRDLVATYVESPERPLRIQIYWRWAPSSERLAGCTTVDLQVSVQTELLDGDPELATASVLPLGEVSCLQDQPAASLGPAKTAANSSGVPQPARQCCWLFRLPNQRLSYAEMVHPQDVVEDELICRETQRQYQLRHRLFATRLEKGVILRARVRGVLLPREHDAEMAAAAYAEFIDAPPPLTT